MARCVLLDLSGVVYEGDHAIPGAIDAVGRLRTAGLGLRFLTNTTRTPKAKLIERLQGMGLEISADEVATPAQVACDWLNARGLKPHLLVHEALVGEFEGCGGTTGDAVVVGDAGTGFTYEAMNAAFRKLVDGADFLALARNRTFKDADGKLSLDAGAFVAALEFATRREATVLGKPSPDFFDTVLESLGATREEAVMVGDDAESDVAGALAAGIGAALLVRTGKYRPGDEDAVEPTPTAVVADLAEAVERILG
ncbi:HAD superfamily hydrolase (TIGR01458 family) [Rhodobium orientis]|uniref:Haloacid dehalogenase-like hydrolase domain-containing protein 2 n=1 Tax=Rhodobium orientis TaxID=34017 RepID=A0A327JMW0_9HYPH|nr:TIGR01458 family HAD-type hydrolase [Rhodobium orientis]MBB4305190.1 HAD superfamily hydrolase (TIGR01458 family) [Rhodobium orientis]MBK5948707.1 hydrolase [Rhodobium orientis]RAI26674.1 TIGR01458 family HAD-type hydrolase [Rhodobium orientis]